MWCGQECDAATMRSAPVRSSAEEAAISAKRMQRQHARSTAASEVHRKSSGNRDAVQRRHRPWTPYQRIEMCGAECVVCWEVERVWEPPAEGARWLQSQRAPRRRGWGRPVWATRSKIGVLNF